MPPTVRRVGAYAKLLANYAVDDAVIEAGEAAELLFVRGLAFCATSDSDGWITNAQVTRYVGAGMRDAAKRARKLVEVGLWESGDGGYQVRSWTKIHDTAEEKGRALAADRERKRSERGQDAGIPAPVRPESDRTGVGRPADNPPESLSLIHDSAEQDSAFIAPPPATRPRDELWEAVIEACGINADGMTSSARGAMNAALKQLREVNATPAAVKLKARRFRQQYTSITLTPAALAKHWPQLDRMQEPARDTLGFAR